MNVQAKKPRTGNNGINKTALSNRMSPFHKILKIHFAGVVASQFKRFLNVNPVPLPNGRYRVDVNFEHSRISPIVENEKEMLKVRKKVFEFYNKYGLGSDIDVDNGDDDEQSLDAARLDESEDDQMMSKRSKTMKMSSHKLQSDDVDDDEQLDF